MCIRHVSMAQPAISRDQHAVCAYCSFLYQTICDLFILGNPIQFDFAISLHLPNGQHFNRKSPACCLVGGVGTFIEGLVVSVCYSLWDGWIRDHSAASWWIKSAESIPSVNARVSAARVDLATCLSLLDFQAMRHKVLFLSAKKTKHPPWLLPSEMLL